jgi:hypothetical protein
MSRPTLFIPAAIFAPLLLAADLGPADERDDRRSVLDAYAAYDDAMQRKDPEALAQCAPDFAEIGVNGQVKTLARVAEETKRLYHVSRAIEQHSTVDAMWFNGDTAATLVDARLVADANDPRTPGRLGACRRGGALAGHLGATRLRLAAREQPNPGAERSGRADPCRAGRACRCRSVRRRQPSHDPGVAQLGATAAAGCRPYRQRHRLRGA